MLILLVCIAIHILISINFKVVDLCVLLPSNAEVAWQCILGAYNKAITPMCTNLCNILNSDFENVAHVLLDLELRHDNPLEDILVSLLQLLLDMHIQIPIPACRRAGSRNHELSATYGPTFV